jgi:hypothetical protein
MDLKSQLIYTETKEWKAFHLVTCVDGIGYKNYRSDDNSKTTVQPQYKYSANTAATRGLSPKGV